MTKKMTVVFHNEELYTDLKVEAARRHVAASEIIAEAVQHWLDDREDEELWPLLQESTKDHEGKNGRPWEEVRKELEEQQEKGSDRSRSVGAVKEEEYRLTLTPSAQRDIEEIRQQASTEDLDRLHKAITDLAANPRPSGARRIRGPDEIMPSHILRRDDGRHRGQ